MLYKKLAAWTTGNPRANPTEPNWVLQGKSPPSISSGIIGAPVGGLSPERNRYAFSWRLEALRPYPQMKISDHVQSCFEDAKAGRFDAALLHACIGIDATSKLIYPAQKKVGKRFVQCIRDYYWLVEPMLGAGVNLELTRFDNVRLTKTSSPDFADITYEIFRCGHTHGDEIPAGFKVLPSEGNWRSQWLIGKNTLRLPDRIVWALLSISIFAKVNERQKVQGIGPFNITLGDHHFPVREWWGQEDGVRPIALEHNQVRVHFQEMGRVWDATEGSATGRIQIVQPNVPERIRNEFELTSGVTVNSSLGFPDKKKGSGYIAVLA